MHLMYVDESGDPGYPGSGAFGSSTDPSRAYVRAGVIVHGWKWREVDRRVADFKRARNLRWNDEIKATWIRRGRGSFKGWTKEDRQTFLNDLLDTIGRELDLSILGVAIDKTKVDISRRERVRNPSVRSLELLLERYNGFSREQRDKSGIVILDANESRSDENLRYFQSYLLNFSDNLDPRRIVEGTLFMPSHTSNLLQVADVCANVMYRKFLMGDRPSAEFDRIQSRVFVEKVWP